MLLFIPFDYLKISGNLLLRLLRGKTAEKVSEAPFIFYAMLHYQALSS
jgi:hypothetical protein